MGPDRSSRGGTHHPTAGAVDPRPGPDGESEDCKQNPQEERPTCVTCGKPLVARGAQTRSLQTTGGEAVKLTRTYGTCPECEVGFFPAFMKSEGSPVVG